MHPRLFLDTVYHAVDHVRMTVDDAAVDAVLRVSADHFLGCRQLIVCQLGGLLRDGTERSIEAGADGTTPKHTFGVDDRKRGCRTQVNDNQR